MRLKPLADQVIVITGASSGIGLITARLAAERGAMVMLIARNGEALADIVRDIRAKGGTADHAVADVGDRDQLRTAAAHTITSFGRIDSWVNNAGVAIYAALLDTPLDEHERLIRTNYFGVVNGAQVALEHMRVREGALITVASVAGDMPSPVTGAYTASKHAVVAFIQSLRIELGADDVPVSVTLIKPSGMATPIAENAANHQAGAPKIPPPVYDPMLVARAILDAAQRPIREITIGGVGRLQVLFANHFPALFERIAPVVGPLFRDRTKAGVSAHNLFVPAQGGMERSADEKGMTVSLYNEFGQHRLMAGTLTAVAFGIATLAWRSLARRRTG